MKRFMGDPDEDADMLRERSPMTYIENVKTPLLVIQGAKDPRVVKPESDQLVDKLRSLGREVEYVVFEDEGHGFTKRQNEVKAMKLSADWLERHLVADHPRSRSRCRRGRRRSRADRVPTTLKSLVRHVGAVEIRRIRRDAHRRVRRIAAAARHRCARWR